MIRNPGAVKARQKAAVPIPGWLWKLEMESRAAAATAKREHNRLHPKKKQPKHIRIERRLP